MLGQCAQSVPLEATLYGGGGGGGGGEGQRAALGKRAAFIIEQGTIMKTKQIFKVYHILLTRIVVLSCPVKYLSPMSKLLTYDLSSGYSMLSDV